MSYLGGGEVLLDCGGGERPRLATSGLWENNHVHIYVISK